jgi:hypothetical protein
VNIAEFLLARIAEDEEAARNADGIRWEWGTESVYAASDGSPIVVGPWGGNIASGDAHHIVRWDPARVLAECKAKRRIVKWAKDWPLRPSRPSDEDAILGPLALPYADHPDYREEWQ